MSRPSDNRTFATAVAVFAVLFTVFTVGIPVVVASCTMPKAPGMAICSICLPATGGNGTSMTSQRNAACCETVVASSPNFNRFLLPKHLDTDRASIVIAASVHPVATGLRSSSVEPGAPKACGHPLAPPGDIPIRLSTLRI